MAANPFDEFDAPAAPPSSASPSDGPNPFDEFDPPGPKTMSTGDVASDVLNSVGSGVTRGTAQLAGFPGDAQQASNSIWDNLSNRAIHGLLTMTGQIKTPQDEADFQKLTGAMKPGAGDSLPTSSQILGGIDQVKDTNYQPKTTAGAYAKTAGEFLPNAIFGPETLANKLAIGVAAPAVASEAAGQYTKGTDMEGPARLLGAAVGGFGAPVAADIARGAVRKAADIAQPMRTSGQEQMAGQMLHDASQDPENVKSILAANPTTTLDDGSVATGQVVPGSQPTTFQLTGDMGLGSAEKTAETQNPVPFQDRRAAQNNARVDTLGGIQPGGSPEDLAAGLKAHLSALDDLESGKVTDATTAAQDAASGLGGQQSPAFYGQKIQDAVQPDLDAATNTARSAVSDLGGTGTPEQYGSTMRGAAADAKTAAKAQRNAIFDAIDPDGTLNTVVTGPRQRANQISDGLSKYDAQPEGAEATILNQMKSLPDVMPFRDLQALDKNITGAMSKEMAGAGETPAWGRLTQLKGAVRDAISNGVANQVAYERHGIATGQMAPEIGLESRLNDFWGYQDAEPIGGASSGTGAVSFLPSGGASPSSYGSVRANAASPGRSGAASGAQGAPPVAGKPPQSLIGFARQAGGIRDLDGSLASRGLNDRFPGLINNKTGVPADSFRQSAAEAGYLGPDTEHAVRTTDVGDLGDALDNHPTYSVHDSDAVLARGERANYVGYQRSVKAASEELKQSIASAGMSPKHFDAEEIHDASVLMAQEHLPWHEALERASSEGYVSKQDAAREAQFRASQEQSYRDPSLGDARAGRVEESYPQPARGTRGAHGEASLNFDQAAADRLELGKQTHTQYAQTFKEGPVAQMLKTNGFAGQYRMVDSGVPNQVFAPGPSGPEKLRAFTRAVGDNSEAAGAVKNYAAMSLRRAAENPDGTLNTAKLSNWISKHQDTLRTMPDLMRQFGNARTASEALKKFEPFTKAQGPSAIPEMFFHSGPGGGEGVQNLRELIGDHATTTSLTDYAASRLRQAAMNPDGTLDPRKVATFTKAHQQALDALPGLGDRFSSAAKATETVSAAAAARKAALDTFQKDAVGKLVGVDDADDVSRIVGGVFGKNNSVGQMRDLAAKATKAGPDAVQGLRKATAEYIQKTFMTNAEAATSGTNKINVNAFQTFVRKNSGALGQVFKPDEMASMQAIADDITRANRSRDAINIPGQPATAQLTHALKAASPEHSSWLEAMFKGAFVGREVSEMLEGIPYVGETAGNLLGHVAGPFVVGAGVAKHLVAGAQSAGLKKVGDLYQQALLNPDVARELLGKVKPPGTTSPGASFGTILARQAPFYASGKPQPNTDQPQQRARGGGIFGGGGGPFGVPTFAQATGSTKKAVMPFARGGRAGAGDEDIAGALAIATNGR